MRKSVDFTVTTITRKLRFEGGGRGAGGVFPGTITHKSLIVEDESTLTRMKTLQDADVIVRTD